MTDKIENLTKEFFEKLKIDIKDLEIISEEDNIFLIKVKSDDSWILIWTHWKNLEIITNILKLILLKNIWENIIIHLEINDYLKAKQEKLKLFVDSKVKLVEKLWKEIKLPFFTAYERKQIHSYISELGNNIYTESKWVWRDRRLYIGKKAEKLTIDIDWSDI